ncbi:MAG TPA: radical SAM protein [Spirochaetota bacterium]|nr:radical SAM protein [Spirochaetota bacterium]
MKIVLILPRVGIYKYKSGAFLKFLRYSPLTMITLASLVPKSLNAEIEIYDEGVEEIKKDSITADVVGITAITGASLRAYAYADYFRKKGIKVIMGGVHATLNPEEAKKHVDSVVIGHAYETWPTALLDLHNNRLKDYYYPPKKIDFNYVVNIDRNFIKKKNFITVNSTQAVFGCPNSCDFCVTPISCKGYHHRPIKDVVNEISKMSGKYVVFVDPSPIENVNYAKELCRALTPLKKKWTGLATTRLVKERELMDLMEKSGCKGLLIGFESLSQNSCDNINKGFNSVADYYTLVKELHKRGIAINGCFVHGLDSDDKDCFKRTLDFVVKADIDLPRFTICTPFPGTPFYEKLKSEGRILTNNWALYNAQHVVFKPKNMTPDELIEGHHKIWKDAYRTSYILKRLLLSRAFPEFAVLANIGYKYYSTQLPLFDEERINMDTVI